MERRINPKALDRLRSTKLSPDVLADGFENLVKQLNQYNYPARSPFSVVMEYREEGNDDVQPGDYFPVITLTLVPCKPNA